MGKSYSAVRHGYCSQHERYELRCFHPQYEQYPNVPLRFLRVIVLSPMDTACSTDRVVLPAKMMCALPGIADISNALLPIPASSHRSHQLVLSTGGASLIHIEEQARAIVYCAFPVVRVVLIFDMPTEAGHRTYSTT